MIKIKFTYNKHLDNETALDLLAECFDEYELLYVDEQTICANVDNESNIDGLGSKKEVGIIYVDID